MQLAARIHQLIRNAVVAFVVELLLVNDIAPLQLPLVVEGKYGDVVGVMPYVLVVVIILVAPEPTAVRRIKTVVIKRRKGHAVQEIPPVPVVVAGGGVIRLA